MVSQKQKVFILDDDEEIHGLYLRYLKSMPLEIVCFSNSEDFLEALKKTVPNLAILDLNLTHHKKEGMLLIKALKKSKMSHLKIIMATGSQEQSILDEAYKNGADDFFLKPISQTALVEKISTLLSIKNNDASKLVKINEADPIVKLSANIEVTTIDYSGFTFKFNGKFRPGYDFEINIPLFQELIGDSMMRASISECDVNEANGECKGRAVWRITDAKKLELKKALKNHLLRKTIEQKKIV